MLQSNSISKLITALVAAQSEFKPVPKSKTGQEGNRKFRYADLADVVGMVTPLLSKHGVFLSQPIILDAGGATRQTTRLQLEDEFIQTDGIKLADDVPGKNLGISVTYARRIDLNGLLGIAPDEDVDAPDLVPGVPQPSTHRAVINVPNNLPGSATIVASIPKATSFEYGANAQARTITPRGTEITDADLPDFPEPEKSTPLPADAAAVADHLLNFVPLTEARNTEIQNRLKDLVANKTVGRRDLSLFLEDQHSGKKQFDVDAKQWEGTIAKIEEAVADGTIKVLLKTKKA